MIWLASSMRHQWVQHWGAETQSRERRPIAWIPQSTLLVLDSHFEFRSRGDEPSPPIHDRIVAITQRRTGRALAALQDLRIAHIRLVTYCTHLVKHVTGLSISPQAAYQSNWTVLNTKKNIILRNIDQNVSKFVR